MRKLLYALTFVGVVSVGLLGQQAGGAFLPGFNYDIPGAWTFTGTIPVLTGNGSLVGTTATQTLTNKTLTTPTLTTPTINTPILASESLTGAGATETLTVADCGQTQLWDTITGSVVTLPAATGSGCTFSFLVTVSNTSGDHSVVVVGNDEFVGGLISVGTTADQSDAFTAAVGGGIDAIQMNGTTEGGLLGTWITVQDIAADTWGLSGIVISTDASATMLASGVSS